MNHICGLKGIPKRFKFNPKRFNTLEIREISQSPLPKYRGVMASPGLDSAIEV
jgi:hypothetical protein